MDTYIFYLQFDKYLLIIIFYNTYVQRVTYLNTI